MSDIGSEEMEEEQGPYLGVSACKISFCNLVWVMSYTYKNSKFEFQPVCLLSKGFRIKSLFYVFLSLFDGQYQHSHLLRICSLGLLFKAILDYFFSSEYLKIP